MHGEQRAAPRRPLYRCCHVTPSGPRRHNVAVPRVDAAMWTALCTTLTDTSTVLDDLRALAEASSALAQHADAELRQLQRAAQGIDAQRDTLLNLHLAGGIDRARFLAKDSALQAQQQALDDQQAALAARCAAARAQQLPLGEIEDLCCLAGRLDNFPDEKLSMYAGW